ncbi:(2Fe-2S)-binding protein [Cryptosporangium aurantiacum]|uniref:Ferric iron reductase protein FhuF, involved in iron transport n=1 Tax=Cryptosporangium aurantiacum TaxID=134849 RepID=A0A1M7JKB4_9ACTN|nr:(2Fe-2S)-binding protein [Cryptosporangium aurantiacum]SHM53213.1 Ferric iron reductase protein FhuF, involved in iron transport [Cryptosporangium aurantiacum]
MVIECDELYRRVALSVPSLAYTVSPAGGARLPGALLTDPGWLAAQVDASTRQWGGVPRRVAGTLWWYSTSSTLVAGPVIALLVTGWVPALAVDEVTFELSHGSVAGVRAARVLGRGPDALAAALGPALAAVIEPLARVSGVGAPSLRAVLGDSVANRALDVARGPAGEALAERVAAGGGLPAPRFLDVPGAGPYLRRSSCCLIYEVPGTAKCASCPRQRPEVRERRMSAVAMGQR